MRCLPAPTPDSRIRRDRPLESGPRSYMASLMPLRMSHTLVGQAVK